MLSSTWRLLFRPGPAAVHIWNPTSTTSGHVKYTNFHSRIALPGTIRSITRVAKEPLLTFRPEKFTSVGQNVIDLSRKRQLAVNVRQPSGLPGHASSAALHYETKGGTTFPFPPQTQGVLYFHQVADVPTEPQIRFRLCETVGDFQRGTDLLLMDGSPWHLSFRELQRFPTRHAAFLNLLQEEYSLIVDPGMIANRIISTLNPHKLLSHNQRVFDLSGLVLPSFYFGDQSKRSQIYYQSSSDARCVKFPASTIGVFYYKQSVTAPRQIGELRFRQCPDTLSFDKGKDLYLPSGKIWSISSNYICTSDMYEALKEALSSENLLDHNTHPAYSVSKKLTFGPTLSSATISKPFLVELSATYLAFNLLGRDMTVHKVRTHTSFRNPQIPSQPLYQGRAVVRFEPYPPTLHKGKRRLRSMLAMRVLELLTPVTRLFDDEYMKPPVSGELLTINYRNKGYVPWAFRTRDSSIEKVITELLPPPSA